MHHYHFSQIDQRIDIMKEDYFILKDIDNEEIVVWNELSSEVMAIRSATDKLRFNGERLKWISGSNVYEYTAFSGLPDMSARESKKDAGPMPQGEYAVDPGKVMSSPTGEEEAWGKQRVKSEPIKSTLDRMKDCFGHVRSGLYIHGGEHQGTIGCIEINDDSEEKNFFNKLKKYGKKIQLIVKFEGEYQDKLEEKKCPYP